MQSARSLILSVSLLVTAALLISVLGLLQEPDSDGVGRDTYGLHSHGYRGVFEVLDELGVEAARSIAPPGGDLPTDVTVALIAPTPAFVAREPAYLRRLSQWVERGGRLVVSPATNSTRQRFDQRHKLSSDRDFPTADLLETLRVTGVRVVQADASSPDRDGPDRSLVLDSRAMQPVEAKDFIGPDGEPLTLGLNAADPIWLTLSEEGISGARWTPLLQETDPMTADRLLAAKQERGAGEIVVVADPDLFANGLLGREQNSVAALKLLSPEGKPVVFDEHYHGLSVRGNPLYLMTVPGFAAITLGLLATTGVWVWRTGTPLGPPVVTPATPRRDLREYVEAMANLLLRGVDGRRFLLRETRQGTLEELGRQFGLAALTPTPARIANAIARQDRPRAEAFTSTLDAIDARLDSPARLGVAETTQLMQKASHCL